MKLVGFKALIETGGVRSIEIFMSRTRLIGVGLVLHRGAKKGVESEYDIHFGQILANKIRNGFLC